MIFPKYNDLNIDLFPCNISYSTEKLQKYFIARLQHCKNIAKYAAIFQQHYSNITTYTQSELTKEAQIDIRVIPSLFLTVY